jgi:predicted HicB family RNase H-like nuclease
MPKDDTVLVQLATRVPRSLHREIKLFCVGRGISVMAFVSSALTTKLHTRRTRPTRSRKR